MYTFKELVNLVEKEIQKCSWQREPASLYTPITYTLQEGGKRVRPVLALLAANMWQERFSSEHISPALGLEILHNFTLLHDDVMDNSPVRRGRDTVHVKWNTNQAILSGDAMLIASFQYIAEAKKDVQKEILDLFAITALEICEGQQLDVEFEERDDVAEEQYLSMIKLKTAVLLACSLKLGAITAGASQEDAKHLYNFGLNMGMAFQLQDDYLDVYAQTEQFGKAVGTDIINNKKTYLLITALRLAEGKQREELLHWLSPQAHDKQQKIEAITNIYNQLTVPDLNRALIQQYYTSALDALEQVQVSKDKKKELLDFASSLNDRKK